MPATPLKKPESVSILLKVFPHGICSDGFLTRLGVGEGEGICCFSEEGGCGKKKVKLPKPRRKGFYFLGIESKPILNHTAFEVSLPIPPLFFLTFRGEEKSDTQFLE